MFFVKKGLIIFYETRGGGGEDAIFSLIENSNQGPSYQRTTLVLLYVESDAKKTAKTFALISLTVFIFQKSIIYVCKEGTETVRKWCGKGL